MATMLADFFSSSKSNVKTGKLCYDLNSLSEELMQVITQPFVNYRKKFEPFSPYVVDAVLNLMSSALFVTSKIEFSNSPILEIKVLQNAFKIEKQGLKYF